MKPISGRFGWKVTILAPTMLLAGVAMSAAANTGAVPPVGSFLLRPGEIRTIEPGKAQVFRTVSAVENGAGESADRAEIERFESESFVEAALVRLHDRDEPAARGISSVFEFEAVAGAREEMKAELTEALELRATRREEKPRLLIMRLSKVPGVSRAVVFATLPNKAADRLGFEAGVGSGLFVVGNCFFKIGILRPKSREVVEPVIRGVQAISRRIDGRCP